MRGVLLDVRQASRLLRRHPAFSAFAIVTLGVGIGAATAVFALVQAVLLQDLPFTEPDRLAWVYNARTERDRAPLSIPDLEDYRRWNATLAGLAAFTNWTANLTGSGDAERLEGTRVSRSQTGDRRAGFLRRAFVVVQIAGAAVLLVCAALVARGFARLERVDPGFTADHALSVQLSLPPARYATSASITRAYEALSIRLRTMNGISAVGAVSLLPLSGLLSTIDVAIADRPAPPPEEVPQAHFRIASPGYFAATGVDVLEGREFTERDGARGQPVAVVSRALAERHWPGQRVVGKFLRIAEPPTSPMLEIVGIVKDVKQFTVDGVPTADLYVPVGQMPSSQAPALAARMYWVIRTDDDPTPLIPEIRRAVRAVDPDVATSSVRSLEEVLALSLSGRRANVRLLEVFGQAAVVLAGIGVYAIASFSVGARRRELAIRSAFGASRRDLIHLVIGGELRPALVGVGGGLAGAFLVARSLGDALFSVSPSDAATYIAVAAGLAVVTCAATRLPAVRAGCVDPAELLRS